MVDDHPQEQLETFLKIQSFNLSFVCVALHCVSLLWLILSLQLMCFPQKFTSTSSTHSRERTHTSREFLELWSRASHLLTSGEVRRTWSRYSVENRSVKSSFAQILQQHASACDSLIRIVFNPVFS